jgi:hypothetical protein
MNNNRTVWNWIATTLREAAWAPIGVVVFYLLGLALGWYDSVPPLDIPTHFMGGVAIAYFYRAAIRNSQTFLGDIPFLVQILFAFTATGTTTVLWEFYEILSDYFLGTQHVFGLNDTLKDMFVGLLGGFLLSLFYRKQKVVPAGESQRR